ncbi:hypothetical protein HanRHA438_Chr11g0528161 [Helianthus annuus]|nr:hypothetical protein HanRHA438_Chr11g0528161 [Helianthus annuus]
MVPLRDGEVNETLAEAFSFQRCSDFLRTALERRHMRGLSSGLINKRALF